MSTRNLRKFLGKTTLPPPDESSDDDFVPLYTKQESRNGGYSLLEVASTSDEEAKPESKSNEELDQDTSQQAKKKKKNNKKKRKGKSANSFHMDEIDRSIREVNAILGEPSPVVDAPKKKANPEAILFTVQQRNLDANNELRRMFGPESEEEGTRRQHNIKLKKNIVFSKTYTTSNKLGLSMSIRNRDNDITYFTFDHNKEYKKMYQSLLDNVSSVRVRGIELEELMRNMFVEGLLEMADICFQMEDFTLADSLIEKCIAHMQNVAHPCFTLAGRRCRLEYKYLENRPFHIALLKHLHMLSNRACHRTALEIAKALLNLDPSDPLAMIFIIDMLALRAREHKWLNDVVEYWNVTRAGKYMFNLQYSQAMCCFHLANRKDSGIDITEADKRLKDCLLKFPFAFMKILECCSHKPSVQLKDSYLFNAFSVTNTPEALKGLMGLYAKFTWSRWREPPVLQWLLSNATELSIKYDTDVRKENMALNEVAKHLSLFRNWPVQVLRHLCVIRPMADLLVDGAVPAVPTYLSSNPVPLTENSVNRYNYQQQRPINRQFVLEFLRTLQPHIDGYE